MGLSIWPLITVVVLCSACGGDRERPAPRRQPAPAPVAPEVNDQDKVRSVVQTLASGLAAEMNAWLSADFATAAAAFEALMLRTSPSGPTAKTNLAAALREVGLRPDAFTAVLQENPELLRWAHWEFDRVGAAAVEKRRGAVRKKMDALPQGDWVAANERVVQLQRSPSVLPDLPTPPDPLATWVEVHSLSELGHQVEEAARSGRPLIIHFRADWALPTRELQEVFADASVSLTLATYQRVFVDVSNGDDEVSVIQETLGAETLPAVLVYRDATALAAALAGRETPPTPSVRIDRVVDGATFGEALSN